MKDILLKATIYNTKRKIRNFLKSFHNKIIDTIKNVKIYIIIVLFFKY